MGVIAILSELGLFLHQSILEWTGWTQCSSLQLLSHMATLPAVFILTGNYTTRSIVVSPNSEHYPKHWPLHIMKFSYMFHKCYPQDEGHFNCGLLIIKILLFLEEIVQEISALSMPVFMDQLKSKLLLFLKLPRLKSQIIHPCYFKVIQEPISGFYLFICLFGFLSHTLPPNLNSYALTDSISESLWRIWRDGSAVKRSKFSSRSTC